MTPLRRLLLSSVLVSFLSGPSGGAAPAAPDARYPALQTEAERLFAQGSYPQAHDKYAEARKLSLSPRDARWVDFRLADTQWRSEAARSDDTRLQAARVDLEKMAAAATREEDKDRVWAEVEESLGDFWWVRKNSRGWYQGWQHYQLAMDWWAGARDVELARTRYLAMVWRAARPPEVDEYYAYGYYGNYIPAAILENALEIAREPEDRTHAHYLLAMSLRQGGDPEQLSRIPAEFESALAGGPSQPWYGDALFSYAEYLENYGRTLQKDDGTWDRQPDYRQALALYRRFLSEFKKGQSRYWEQAKARAEAIVHADLEVSVSNFFVPGSEIQYYLSWRNVAAIELGLYKTDLTAIGFSGDVSSSSFLDRVELSSASVVKRWTKATGDKGEHKPGQSVEHYEGKLEPGAYVLEARAGKEHHRELVLVTDASVLVKASPAQVLLYVTEIAGGAPLAKANVVVWQRIYKRDTYSWRKRVAATNDLGVAVVPRERSDSSDDIFVAVSSGARQTYSTGSGPSQASQSAAWRIYAFTDRPAYRPGDEAKWKIFARVYDAGHYTTPARQSLDYEIHDPQGAKVADGTVVLDAFGAAAGAFTLTAKMTLGAYRVDFWTAGHGTTVGNATLLRLEEYKLPEFTVLVKTPEVDGKRRTFHPGDKVEAQVQVDYYFGGAVANADVQVLVYQTAFSRVWQTHRDYPWFYEDIDARRYENQWGRSVVKQDKLKTDAAGRAKVVFDTPRGAGQDFEYVVEARVTDSSRREVAGQGSVRVTRMPYDVHLSATHALYRPTDHVTVDVEALDANDQGVSVEGKVAITRDAWSETWLDPRGKEASGKEHGRRMREPDFAASAWRLVRQGYHHEELGTRTVRTGPDGKAQLTYTPEREGYYRFAWTSRPRGTQAVTTEATVWVATRATADLGYQHGGLELLVDNDTVRPGATAPVLLSVPTSDRWVLLTAEADELYKWEVVHVTGTVKLVELHVDDTFVPNIFLQASMVADRQLFSESKQVIVPPVKHFLEVAVEPDSSEHRPGEPGTFVVTARDEGRHPVAAQVAVSVVDEAIFAIQPELAGDPRQFYFGTKRGLDVQTQSTFNQRSFAKLVATHGAVMEEGQAREELASPVDDMDESGARLGPRDALKKDGSLAELSRSTVRVAGGGKMGGDDKRKEADSPKPVAAKAPASTPTERERADQPEPTVVVRSDFRATALWAPTVLTDSDGRAKVTLTYPDSTTSWRATARAATAEASFGMGTGSTRTRMPLQVRLEGPRFFVVGDQTVVSALLNNDTRAELTASVTLAAEGLAVQGSASASVKVPARGEAHVEWHVDAQRAGQAHLKVIAKGGTFADAMEKTFPVVEHGIDKLLARSGKLRGDAVSVSLDLPKERRVGSTSLTVDVAPSLAVTMLDALPYLVDYPYGCTEQTLSRFLPAVIVAKTLKDTGLDPGKAMSRVFGGIEADSAGKTHPNGKRSLEDLGNVTQAGLQRLYEFQHSDGGWGWWKMGDSDRYMTAYVVWGLSLARDAGLEVSGDVLARGAEYLKTGLVHEENDPDRAAWLLHALGTYYAPQRGRAPEAFERKALDRVWKNHTRLTPYGRALFGLAESRYGERDRAQLLVSNLEVGAVKDARPDVSVVMSGGTSEDSVMGTAHWGEDTSYWRWSDGAIESTSFALMALAEIDAKSVLVEPTMNWLVKNRRGAQWTNTRDTSIAVMALNAYLKASGEVASALSYEVSVNGNAVASKSITPDEALGAPSRFVVDPRFIRDGANTVQIRRTRGAGVLYFSAEARFFSLEEPVTPAGHEIFVRRQYFKEVGRKTLLKGYVYDREPLDDGGAVTSGDRVEVVVTVETKNDYEYLLFEDLKPAGLEAVELQSGKPLFARELKSGSFDHTFDAVKGHGRATDDSDYTARSAGVYQELRDRKVALFVDKLSQGVWEIRYSLRAEVPGHFHALPVMAHAMYVPEIRANGAEVRIDVKDAP